MGATRELRAHSREGVIADLRKKINQMNGGAGSVTALRNGSWGAGFGGASGSERVAGVEGAAGAPSSEGAGGSAGRSGGRSAGLAGMTGPVDIAGSTGPVDIAGSTGPVSVAGVGTHTSVGATSPDGASLRPVRASGEARGGGASAWGRPAGPGVPGVLTVPAWLASELASGGLPRGAVTAVANCPAVIVDLLAEVTGTGGCAAIVGYPELALAAIDAAGGDIERLVVVTDPNPHAGAVVGTLVEGLDMVVYAPQRPVTPTLARPVEARLRKSHCCLLVVGSAASAGVRRSSVDLPGVAGAPGRAGEAGGMWPGAALTLNARMTGVWGLGWGTGRIRGINVDGSVWGKAQPPRSFSARLGHPGSRDSGAGERSSTDAGAYYPSARAL